MSTLIYKCPHCGAVLEYDAETELMTCDHCNSTFTPQEAMEEAMREEGPQEQTEQTVCWVVGLCLFC